MCAGGGGTAWVHRLHRFSDASFPRSYESDFKTDDDTECQLVHTLAHAIVFIVSICYLLISGAADICPFLLERPGSSKLGRPEL